jgi:very-short-patch-repair endonuclease
MKRVPEHLTANARELRNNSTKAERLLWLRLRQYRPRFTRQLAIEPFIVDLACRQAKLAIELDGGQHADAVDYDNKRTRFLESQGWAVVRLWNNEVEANPDGAAEFVLMKCSERLGGATHPQPLPSREGRIRRPRLR